MPVLRLPLSQSSVESARCRKGSPRVALLVHGVRIRDVERRRRAMASVLVKDRVSSVRAEKEKTMIAKPFVCDGTCVEEKAHRIADATFSDGAMRSLLYERILAAFGVQTTERASRPLPPPTDDSPGPRVVRSQW
jgi:hypothetical protein